MNRLPNTHPARPAKPSARTCKGTESFNGSRRAEMPGVWLVALARHDVGSVVRQRQVADGSHELPTLLTLLRATPLQQQTVTLDAGLLCAETTQVIRAQQGDYLGVIKGNQGEIKAAIDDWIAEQVFSPSPGAAGSTNGGEIAGSVGNPRPVGSNS